jgi:hypothetical protein
MKRFWKVLSAVIFSLLFCLSTLCACGGSGGETTASIVFSDKDGANTIVVIQVDETDGKANVFNAMEYLKAQGELSYVAQDGAYGAFITEINGKGAAQTGANSGYSWMLYTSDKDYANPDMGTVEYGGNTYGSATVGASSVIVKAGEYYIWYYTAWSY